MTLSATTLQEPMADTAPKPAPTFEREQRLMATLTNCVFILTVLASMAAAHWLESLLTPLMVAIFALILIDSLAHHVGRLLPKIPEWVRVGVACTLICLVLVGAGALVVHAAPRFAASLINAITQAQALGYQATAQLNLPHFARFEQLDVKPYVSGLLAGVREMATGLILVMVYLGFLLASRATFHDKVNLLFKTPQGREHAERVFQRVRLGAENYIGLQALKGVILGFIFWGVLRVFGVHNAIFIGFLAFLASFIPILGPAAAVGVPVLLCLAQYGLGWRPLLMFVSLQAAVVAIDSVLLPRLQGERLDVDPVVVLVSLSFWSLIFGVIGALFSTILTVVVIAIASETPRLRWLAVVLSKRGDALRESAP
jgi:predicted PurR-regulated permease PerM